MWQDNFQFFFALTLYRVQQYTINGFELSFRLKMFSILLSGGLWWLIAKAVARYVKPTIEGFAVSYVL